jgi:hypothetical protein
MKLEVPLQKKHEESDHKSLAAVRPSVAPPKKREEKNARRGKAGAGGGRGGRAGGRSPQGGREGGRGAKGGGARAGRKSGT